MVRLPSLLECDVSVGRRVGSGGVQIETKGSPSHGAGCVPVESYPRFGPFTSVTEVSVPASRIYKNRNKCNVNDVTGVCHSKREWEGSWSSLSNNSRVSNRLEKRPRNAVIARPGFHPRLVGVNFPAAHTQLRTPPLPERVCDTDYTGVGSFGPNE